MKMLWLTLCWIFLFTILFLSGLCSSDDAIILSTLAVLICCVIGDES